MPSWTRSTPATRQTANATNESRWRPPTQHWTLAELAAVYGISAQRVQQILSEYAPRLAEGRRARRRAERRAEDERRRRQREQQRAERLRHGTRRRYVLGCRCERCRAANAEAWRQGYARRRQRSVTGVRRVPAS